MRGAEADANELGYTQGGARRRVIRTADGRCLRFGHGATLRAVLALMSRELPMLRALADMHPPQYTRWVCRTLSQISALIARQPPDPLDEAAFKAIVRAWRNMLFIQAWLGDSRPPPAEPAPRF